jgi:hypothetical protein
MSHPQLTPRRRAALEAVEAGGVRVNNLGSYRNRGGDPISQSAVKWLRDKRYVAMTPADWGSPSAPVEITDAGRDALARARQAEEEPL